jgi:hypothetical protein
MARGSTAYAQCRYCFAWVPRRQLAKHKASCPKGA